MFSAFRTFVEDQQLWQPHHRILAAVSGGLDSVVLAHLLHLGDWPFALGHLNFSLRAAASDADAALVRTLGKAYGVAVYDTVVDTRKARQPGESIQMTARRLRYDWLEKIREREGFDWIATAHQVDDSLETTLLHLAKGTGLKGLLGIPLRKGRVVRPLLFATRRQVEAFARREGLTWREDASNLEDTYDRNKIRLHVLPVLRQLNPRLSETAVQTFAHLRQSALLADEAAATWKARCVKQEEESGRVVIELTLLGDHPALQGLLFRWLQPYGFSGAQVGQITDSLGRPGARFDASDYRLLVDRQRLVLERQADASARSFFLPEAGHSVRLDGGQRLSASTPRPVPSVLPGSESEAWLDAESLSFPLRVRHWQPGDVFQPLGMEGRHQKVKDFFTNQKLDRFQKERVWLVETREGHICWIAGFRIDHRFRLHPKSRQCIVLKME